VARHRNPTIPYRCVPWPWCLLGAEKGSSTSPARESACLPCCNHGCGRGRKLKNLSVQYICV
jgi:hypothetical protein